MRPSILFLFSLTLFAGPDIFDAIRNGDQSAVASLANLANTPRSDGTTPLLHAVVTADAAMVDLLLRHKADPKAVNSGGYTPLHYALSDLNKTKALIAAGADVNAAAKNGMTPLRIAANRKGGQQIVDALLAAGAKPSSDAVEAAAAAGVPTILVTLLKKGATLAPKSPALVNAAVVDCLACAPILLTAGVDVNQLGVRGQTALQNAAAYQNLEFVRLLLDQGAPIDPLCARGYSALMRAAIAYDRNPAVVNLLLARGARTDLRRKRMATRPSPSPSVSAGTIPSSKRFSMPRPRVRPSRFPFPLPRQSLPVRPSNAPYPCCKPPLQPFGKRAVASPATVIPCRTW